MAAETLERYFPFDSEDEIWMIRNIIHHGNTVLAPSVVNYYKKNSGDKWKAALESSLDYETGYGAFRVWSVLINGLEVWFAERI